MNAKSRKLIVLIIVVFIAIGFMASLSVFGKNDKKDYSQKLVVSLFDGAYGDYDDDGHEDDVQCYMTIQYLTDIVRKKYRAIVHLTLPSGETYDYGFFVNTFCNKVTFRLLFYNHAREAGDYKITVELLYYVPGLYYDTTHIVFDPPTEQIPDTEPPSFNVAVC
ncbi:MAG: hypothetical protein ACTSYD_00530 [Candidatus Heimdallarchaeaceae archaeon]